jgi:hypothetical protein
MTTESAWQYVFSHWGCPQWQPLPPEVKSALRLHGKMGVCHYSLVTRTGAQGMDEFVHRVNSKS